MKVAEELFFSVSKAVHVGDKVVDLLAVTSTVDVFQFKHFCLWGNLAELSDHCVGFNMSITVFKQDVSMAGNLCINEKIFQKLSKEDFFNLFAMLSNNWCICYNIFNCRRGCGY